MKLSEIAGRLGITETQTTELLKEAGLKSGEINERDIPDLQDLLGSKAIQKPADTLTVTTAKENDPDNLTGGIIPSQPTGLGQAQAPNIPQGISIPHLESPINLNLGAAQTAQVQAINLRAQIEQQQALVEGLEAFKHRTTGLAAISTVLNDLELNWALDNAGLSIEGTRDERLARWEQYNTEKRQEINARSEAINALLAQSQNLLGSFKTRDGRPLIGR